MWLATNAKKMDSNDRRKATISNILKTLGTSALAVLIIAAGSVIYALITRGRFWPGYIFTSNLGIGTFLILTGIILFALPVRLKKSKLLDHSTLGEKRMEAREKKRAMSYNLIYVGICNIIITFAAQYLLSLIWQ